LILENFEQGEIPIGAKPLYFSPLPLERIAFALLAGGDANIAKDVERYLRLIGRNTISPRSMNTCKQSPPWRRSAFAIPQGIVAANWPLLLCRRNTIRFWESRFPRLAGKVRIEPSLEAIKKL